LADHLRGAGPLIEQVNELAVQNIDLFTQFFERHSILELEQLSAFSRQLSARPCRCKP
jgi:hypothetical protein